MPLDQQRQLIENCINLFAGHLGIGGQFADNLGFTVTIIYRFGFTDPCNTAL